MTGLDTTRGQGTRLPSNPVLMLVLAVSKGRRSQEHVMGHKRMGGGSREVVVCGAKREAAMHRGGKRGENPQ